MRSSPRLSEETKMERCENTVESSFHVQQNEDHVHPEMSECAVDFAKSLSEMSADKSETDMKDAFTKYTNDVIATSAFGIKFDSMSDPTNKFYVYGKDASNFQGLRGLKLVFFATFPWFIRAIGWKFLSDKER